MDVIVPIESSVGARMVLAARSQKMQNTPPSKKQAGITRDGEELFNIFLVI